MKTQKTEDFHNFLHIFTVSVQTAVLSGGGSCGGGFAAPSVCPAGGQTSALLLALLQLGPRTTWTGGPGSVPAFSQHSWLPAGMRGLQTGTERQRQLYNSIPGALPILNLTADFIPGLTWAEQRCGCKQGVLSLRHPQRNHAVEEVEHWCKEILTALCSRQQMWKKTSNSFIVWAIFPQLVRLRSVSLCVCVCTHLNQWVPCCGCFPLILRLWESCELTYWKAAVLINGEKKRKNGYFIQLSTCVSSSSSLSWWFFHLDWGLLGCRKTAGQRAGTWRPMKRWIAEKSGLRNPGGQNLWEDNSLLLLLF